MALWAILAPAGFQAETIRELAHKKITVYKQHGDFFLFRGEPQLIAWSSVTWLDVKELSFTSINDGAKKLRPLARVWEYLPLEHRGRANLIFEQLRALKRDAVSFPSRLELSEGAGAFTLLDQDDTIYWCRTFDRPHPLGKLDFVEDRLGPPSRAYLKLWEAFCLLGEWPGQDDQTLDLGSSPGGWTWVLASLGARVVSVDRAPLEPRIAAMPLVQFRTGDAFQVKPQKIDAIDWLCSDVICAPEKLLDLVRLWLDSGKVSRFVCTLKFQGEADPVVVEEFAKLGRVVHLHHNKHELTFLKVQNPTWYPRVRS